MKKMAYTKFHEVTDVFSFSLHDELIAYCTNSGKLCVVNPWSFNEVWNSDVKNASSVIWYDDVLYARDASGYGAIHFFTKNGERHRGFIPEGRYVIDQFSNKVAGQVVFYGVSDMGVRQVGLQEIKREQARWLIDLHVGRSFHTPEFVFALLSSESSVTTIACLSASDGELLWQLNLTDKLIRPASVYEHESKYSFTITSLVAMHANKLTVGVKWDPATHRLVSIDCSTGSIDHYWSDIALATTAQAQQVGDGSGILYLRGSNRLAKETQYVEINLAAGSTARTGVVQSLLREELVVRDWVLRNGKIYFTAIKNERFPTHIGILDYNTLDLLWWQKIIMADNDFLMDGMALEASRDHLYVLDTLGTLHCFKDINI
jgi:outer membrane protein assembly factor BamB